jgi:galactokinase
MDNRVMDKLLELLPNAAWKAAAPGRVNLLGEHVDYNDGPVLPAAIDRFVRLVAQPCPDRLVHIQALDFDGVATFHLDQVEKKLDNDGQPLPGWACYPAGVAWVLQKHGYRVEGLHAVFSSDIPIGAGLSSSAAVEMIFAATWQASGGWNMDRMTMAKLCLEAETEYIGVKCGIMDQFAIANGIEGHALHLDTRSLEWTPIPLPDDCTIVIANSGVQRSLSTSAYNQRFEACQEAVRLLQKKLPDIRALRDISPVELERNKAGLPEVMYKRARHVVEECVRVDLAVERLQAGDAVSFGKFMIKSHASLRDDYEVSCPELDFLVETAIELKGCWGARLTGAGFGGCTVNLVQKEKTTDFIRQLKDAYHQKTGLETEIYSCHASSGVEAWNI